ncbi:MAG: hypothetical protein WC547_06065, partial [Candidatus Omnitrophota bacterium]
MVRTFISSRLFRGITTAQLAVNFGNSIHHAGAFYDGGNRALDDIDRELNDIRKAKNNAKTPQEWMQIAEWVMAISERLNAVVEQREYASEKAAVWRLLFEKAVLLTRKLKGLIDQVNPFAAQRGLSLSEKVTADKLLVKRSALARDVAGAILRFRDNEEVLKYIRTEAETMLVGFLKEQVAQGKTKQAKADDTLKKARIYLNEWLDPANNIPDYIIRGIYRGMLEGRSADILYCFGFGWREFGTAGIRNPAVQSSFPVIQEMELDEFARSPFAPILTGPNLINAATLLQQEAAIVRIIRDLQAKIKANDPLVASIEPEFRENILNNLVVMAYDSRLNGEYFAELLSAAFLKDGISVRLFDNAAGVPHLAWAAKRERAAFGFLISASHSEANYNGFKAFLGHQMSQVDEASKNMILDAREQVGYQDMNLDLAIEKCNLAQILATVNDLKWLGGAQEKEGKDYYGREFIPFYPWYYGLVKERSPLNMLDKNAKENIEQMKVARPLKILYTAFFGVGAVPAADFKSFLTNEAGYRDVDIVKTQTLVMDGMFPGHVMPDPGIVKGWIANLIDYIKQYAGEDLSNIEDAIEALNSREVGVATDPDIDRAGILIGLPEGIHGNIKVELINAVKRYIADNKINADSQKIGLLMNAKLNDKLLLTANDAWTFMMFWKLRMMEENNVLEKDRLYIIEKSHVTTSALERLAAQYRNKGYPVYVANTYVGFTEIGKKGRDLFMIAKLSCDIHKELERNGTVSAELIAAYTAANAELKANVPYQSAGISVIDETLSQLETIAAGNTAAIESVSQILNIISRMHILSGVEESNGYGELGRWNREEEKAELNHISDKDGSLAAFEFLELLSCGTYILKKAPYDMYKDMIAAIGLVCTINSALFHPGLNGVQEKLDEMGGFEKILAYEIQKRLDNGIEVKLFNGRYTVTKVEIYRDAKRDQDFLSYAEEGVRLYMKTRSGSEVIVTYRPSGTGDTNRVYSWLLGVVPQEGEDLEAYQKAIRDEMDRTVIDFYGVEDHEKGYAELPVHEFRGLIMALKEAGVQRQHEMFGRAFTEGPLVLSDTEEELLEAVAGYALAAKKGASDEAKIIESREKNRAAWKRYLASEEVRAMKNKLEFRIDGHVVARIPKAAVIAWQAGLIDYLISLIEATNKAQIEAVFPDQETLVVISKRLYPYAKTISSKQGTLEVSKDGGIGLKQKVLNGLSGFGEIVYDINEQGVWEPAKSLELYSDEVTVTLDRQDGISYIARDIISLPYKGKIIAQMIGEQDWQEWCRNHPKLLGVPGMSERQSVQDIDFLRMPHYFGQALAQARLQLDSEKQRSRVMRLDGGNKESARTAQEDLDLVRYYYNMGNNYLSDQRWDEAETVYLKALEQYFATYKKHRGIDDGLKESIERRLKDTENRTALMAVQSVSADGELTGVPIDWAIAHQNDGFLHANAYIALMNYAGQFLGQIRDGRRIDLGATGHLKPSENNYREAAMRIIHDQTQIEPNARRLVELNGVSSTRKIGRSSMREDCPVLQDGIFYCHSINEMNREVGQFFLYLVDPQEEKMILSSPAMKFKTHDFDTLIDEVQKNPKAFASSLLQLFYAFGTDKIVENHELIKAAAYDLMKDKLEEIASGRRKDHKDDIRRLGTGLKRIIQLRKDWREGDEESTPIRIYLEKHLKSDEDFIIKKRNANKDLVSSLERRALALTTWDNLKKLYSSSNMLKRTIAEDNELKQIVEEMRGFRAIHPDDPQPQAVLHALLLAKDFLDIDVDLCFNTKANKFCFVVDGRGWKGIWIDAENGLYVSNEVKAKIRRLAAGALAMDMDITQVVDRDKNIDKEVFWHANQLLMLGFIYSIVSGNEYKKQAGRSLIPIIPPELISRFILYVNGAALKVKFLPYSKYEVEDVEYTKIFALNKNRALIESMLNDFIAVWELVLDGIRDLKHVSGPGDSAAFILPESQELISYVEERASRDHQRQVLIWNELRKNLDT